MNIQQGPLFDSQKKEENEVYTIRLKLGPILIVLAILLFLVIKGYSVLYKHIKNIESNTQMTQMYMGDIWKSEMINTDQEIKSEKEESKEAHRIPCKDLGIFRLTFYTPHELGASHANALRTATGTRPKEGRTIAVDPKIIKRNSLVYIEGWGYYIAEDTGAAIKGNRIDIFLNSYQMAKSLGNKRKARVYLIKE